MVFDAVVADVADEVVMGDDAYENKPDDIPRTSLSLHLYQGMIKWDKLPVRHPEHWPQ